MSTVPFTMKQATHWSGGWLRQGAADVRFAGVSIDTRSSSAGQLFFAIRGPRFDAHDYLGPARESGAAGFVIEHGAPLPDEIPGDFPVIEVPDTTRALGNIGAGHRADFDGIVIGLTGSCGKTTTKEMCAAVIGAAMPCHKTLGNLNNDYGVPLTLLRRERAHRAMVIEMGMSHRGEIARLAEIAQPTIGLVTNIGTAHIEFLGSIEEIAAEKGDLFAVIGPTGIAVANQDDPRVATQSRRAAGSVLSYGRRGNADVSASAVRFEREGAYNFLLETPGKTTPIRVRGLAETTVINALAAAAVGIACDLDPETIAGGLDAYRPIAGRMSPRTIQGGITLIDDTYNANPQSLEAALLCLSELRGDGDAIAALGAMGELGEDAASAYQNAGARIVELGIGRLVVVDDAARGIAEGARAAGMSNDRVHVAKTHDEAADWIRSAVEPGDWILVKGSRSAHMERIVELLANEESP